MSRQHHKNHAGHQERAAHDQASHLGGQDGPHNMDGLNSMALSATLHCLTGCAIGEILGLMIGTAIGLSTGWTVALAIALAFLFGYTLSTFPLVKTGLGVGAALSIVFAADTLSIATMEVVDNLVMAVIPGAMDAGLVNWVFWISMMIALSAAFAAAYPVNRYLLQRGKGHALTHEYHHGALGEVTGARRFIPNLSTATLAAAIVAFMLGGLAVAVAAELDNNDPETGMHANSTAAVLAPLAGGRSPALDLG
jgi:preprotein translocase subunit SecG